MAATRPGRNPHTGEAQGELVEHPKGSNGGVHRGPDLVPFRRNVVRAIILHQLCKAGLSLADVKAKRKRRHAQLIPGAMIEYCGEGYEQIALKAALGDDPRVFGPFVSMMAHIHTVLQPAKDEKGGGQTPRRAIFIGENETVPSADQPASPAGEPGAVVDKDGQTYEAVE